MKKVLVLGAGRVSTALVDYFVDECGYSVCLADRDLACARDVAGNRSRIEPTACDVRDAQRLHPLVEKSDLVVSLVPRPFHPLVAQACLAKGKHMVTTSYVMPELRALDAQLRARGILIVNEIGEDPGIDHLVTQKVLDTLAKEGCTIQSLHSYGAGLPAFDCPRNPFGYKFSWDPRTFFVSAKTSARYLEQGRVVEIPGNQLFERFWMVEIGDLGTFESFPNKDSLPYLEPFGLANDVTFYRGLLRYPGFCSAMRNLFKLGLGESDAPRELVGMCYRDLTKELVGARDDTSLEAAVAAHLAEPIFADTIHQLDWLGLFSRNPIPQDNGSPLDVLLERMLAKMSYTANERDMILVHVDAVATTPEGKQVRERATMVVEGNPNGDSAMSRAVGLPAAMTARRILEKKLVGVGVQMPPTMPQMWQPLLAELDQFGFQLKQKRQQR